MFQISFSPTNPQTWDFKGAMSFQERDTKVLSEFLKMIPNQTTLDLTHITSWDETTVGAMFGEIAATGKQIHYKVGSKDPTLCLKLSLR
jgi:hypothetical protein